MTIPHRWPTGSAAWALGVEAGSRRRRRGGGDGRQEATTATGAHRCGHSRVFTGVNSRLRVTAQRAHARTAAAVLHSQQLGEPSRQHCPPGCHPQQPTAAAAATALTTAAAAARTIGRIFRDIRQRALYSAHLIGHIPSASYSKHVGI